MEENTLSRNRLMHFRTNSQQSCWDNSGEKGFSFQKIQWEDYVPKF